MGHQGNGRTDTAKKSSPFLVQCLKLGSTRMPEKWSCLRSPQGCLSLPRCASQSLAASGFGRSPRGGDGFCLVLFGALNHRFSGSALSLLGTGVAVTFHTRVGER